MNIEKELKPLKEVLCELRKEGKILVALLYGSYASIMDGLFQTSS